MMSCSKELACVIVFPLSLELFFGILITFLIQDLFRLFFLLQVPCYFLLLLLLLLLCMVQYLTFLCPFFFFFAVDWAIPWWIIKTVDKNGEPEHFYSNLHYCSRCTCTSNALQLLQLLVLPCKDDRIYFWLPPSEKRYYCNIIIIIIIIVIETTLWYSTVP